MPKHTCGSWPGTALSEISKAEGYGVERMPSWSCFCVQGAAAGLLLLSSLSSCGSSWNHAWLSFNLTSTKESSPGYSSVSLWIYFLSFILGLACVHGTFWAPSIPLSHLAAINWQMSFAPVPVCLLKHASLLVSPCSIFADGSFQTVLKQLPQTIRGFKNWFSLNSKD